MNNATNLVIDEALVKKILETVDAGLTAGKGIPVPGKMCVEAAVNYALGLPHGDDPDCVGKAVRSFKINLNDGKWSSTAARASGMRQLAVAQLGSNTIDQIEFANKIVFSVITKLLPSVLRKAGLESDAIDCESADDLKEAHRAVDAANATAYAAAYAANVAADAAYAADAAAYAANAAADAAYAANAAANVAADAAYAANVAVSAATNAAAADAAAYAANVAVSADTVPICAAGLCLEVLKEMKSPGCEWLWLCDSSDEQKKA